MFLATDETFGGLSTTHSNTASVHGRCVQAMKVGGGIGQTSRRRRSQARAKQRRSDFFGELEIGAGQKQIVWIIDINHGHFGLRRKRVRSCSSDLRTVQSSFRVRSSAQWK